MSAAAPTNVRAPVRARWVVRQALRAYRANWRRVLIAAWLVLVPVNLLASLTATQVDSGRDGLGVAVGGRVVLALAGGLAAALGTVLYAGVLDGLVAEQLHGQARTPWRAALRSTPVARLLLASILLTVVTVIGLLVVVLPGLLAFTLLVLVGPLVSEGHSIPRAFRRSARLVWPHLWLVVALVTLPMVARTLLEDGLAGWLDASNPLIGAVVMQGALAATLGAFVGLVEVVLTDALVSARDMGGGSLPGRETD